MWIVGLRKANNGERDWIIRAENLALSRAYEDSILELGSAPDVLIPHCPDLQHNHVLTKWRRGGGLLYVEITVRFRGKYPARVYRWKGRNPGKRRKSPN